jgi:hypothetical protein
MSNTLRKVTSSDQKKICHCGLKNIDRINNRDLVDLTAHHVIGHYLEKGDKV